MRQIYTAVSVERLNGRIHTEAVIRRCFEQAMNETVDHWFGHEFDVQGTTMTVNQIDSMPGASEAIIAITSRKALAVIIPEKGQSRSDRKY